MKRVTIFTVALLSSFWCAASTTDSISARKISEIASQIQKKYAPDKRVEYFNVEATKGEENSYRVESTRADAIAEFKLLISRENSNLKLSESVLPSAELKGVSYGLANLSVINNRYIPSHSAEMATQTLLGTPVQILKKDKGYYFIRTPDNYLSWTEAAGIYAGRKSDIENWIGAEKLIFTATYGHAFSEASETSAPVSDLVGGNVLRLIGKAGNFYKVAFPDNRLAYVPVQKMQMYSDWVKKPNPVSEQIITSAKGLLGVPYLWGGTSSKGVDCSGFTKNSYFMHGIILPRDASQQALVGEAVDIMTNDSLDVTKALKNLKPGDLLFFAGDSRTRRVTHTAIYLGDGKFIHSAGLVRINSMIADSADYADFQTRTVVSARRMLTAIGQSGVSRVDHHPYYKLDY